MELDQHATNHAVREILDGLVKELPGYRWERICAFSDGKETTIIEVSLYRKQGSEMAVTLSYQLETGALINCRYDAYNAPLPDSLIDLLLDICNFERAKQLRG
jgi:hypothetical protein